MKTPLVSDISTEQNITTFFLVCEKEIRNTREGKAYLRLELGDRSGTIEARMWDQFETAAKGINRDDFVKVQARVEIYKNRPQLSVMQVRLAKKYEAGQDVELDLRQGAVLARAIADRSKEAEARMLNDWANSIAEPEVANTTCAWPARRSVIASDSPR